MQKITKFIAKDSDNEVNEMLKKDKTANKLKYDANYQVSGAGAAWRSSERAIIFNGITSVTAVKHEIGHSLGLPHAVFILGSSLFGNIDNAVGNGAYDYSPQGSKAGLMSYYQNNNGQLLGREVKFMLSNAIKLSRTVNKNVVKIHLSGYIYKYLSKSQLEKQIDPTMKVKGKLIKYIMKIRNISKHKYNDQIIH